MDHVMSMVLLFYGFGELRFLYFSVNCAILNKNICSCMISRKTGILYLEKDSDGRM